MQINDIVRVLEEELNRLTKYLKKDAYAEHEVDQCDLEFAEALSSVIGLLQKIEKKEVK